MKAIYEQLEAMGGADEEEIQINADPSMRAFAGFNKMEGKVL